MHVHVLCARSLWSKEIFVPQLHQSMFVLCCDENSCADIVPVSSIQEYKRSGDNIEPEVTVPQAGTSGIQDATLSACMYVCLICLCTV